MNKAQLITAMAEEAGITKVDAKKALDAFVKVAADALANGDKIALVGFGSFSVARKPARTGRHPRTGSTIRIAPRSVCKFRPGAELSAKLK